jgi:heme exporter protein B
MLIQELKLNWRQKVLWLYPGLFLVIVLVLFGIILPSDQQILLQFSPGIYWVTIILSVLLVSQTIFREELSEGMLEQYALADTPLWEIMLIKLSSQAICLIVPCLLFTPLFVYAFNLPGILILILSSTLLLSIPALQALGAVMGLLTITLRQGGGLLAILILPLMVPVLILCVSITEQAILGAPLGGQLAWLAILCVLSMATMPFAMAAALRIGIWIR